MPIALVLAVGCPTGAANEPNGGELVVFAAASLTQAFQDIAAEFERDNPGVAITFNFAGSQQLRTQLEHGARADVFASADWLQMKAVEDAGLVSGEPVGFVSNSLVVIVSSRNAEITSLESLARPGAKLVLAQPQVPAGAYARTIINNLADSPQYGAEYGAGVLGNVVSEEANVRNVAQKVALGEADAGMVYRTDAMIADISQRVRVIPIPDRSNVMASYPIAVLSESGQPDLARRFIDFILSDQGQRVLSTYGFGPARSTETSQAGRYSADVDGQ